jgi:hypothetical protein
MTLAVDRPKLRVLDASDASAHGHLGDVMISVFRGVMTRSGLERIHQAAPSTAAQRPRGLGYLCVIMDNIPPPDAATRGVFAAMMRDDKTYRAGAIVAEGTGFHASIVRGVVTGLVLLARPRMPVDVIQGTRTGVAWLTRHLDYQDGREEALLRAVEDLRRLTRATQTS